MHSVPSLFSMNFLLVSDPLSFRYERYEAKVLQPHAGHSYNLSYGFPVWSLYTGVCMLEVGPEFYHMLMLCPGDVSRVVSSP